MFKLTYHYQEMTQDRVVQAAILPDGRHVVITARTIVVDNGITIEIPSIYDLDNLLVISDVYVAVSDHTTVSIVNLITKGIDRLRQPDAPIFTMTGVRNLAVSDSFILAVGLPNKVCLWEPGSEKPTLLDQSDDVEAIVQLDDRLVSATVNGILTFWR